MTKRRYFLQVLAATALSLIIPFASAQIKEGENYTLISPAQPGGENGKIEVIEFFSFGCPHCYDFSPLVTKWAAGLPKDVVFRHVPVSFGRKSWKDLSQLYITLKAMHLADKLSDPVFKAVHQDRINFSNENARNEWVKKQGIDVTQFNSVWSSFGVGSMLKQAEEMTAEFKVQYTPILAINGKYWAGLETDSFEIKLKTQTSLSIASAQVRVSKNTRAVISPINQKGQ